MKIDESFHRSWQAQPLSTRPLILPRQHFTYPTIAEEVERGALEVMVTPRNSEAFLATCALGFKDEAAPSGIWSTPHPDWLCALSGGYAYLINAENPGQFTMIELRPVLAVFAATYSELDSGLLLFVGHRRIVAWGREGIQWTSENLSDEGIHVGRIEDSVLCGRGWEMRTDHEYEFDLDLKTGKMTRK